MVELRGIIINYFNGGRTVKLFTRGERGDDYTTLIFPSGKPLTRGTIIKFLGDHFGHQPGHVKIAPHIVIPE